MTDIQQLMVTGSILLGKDASSMLSDKRIALLEQIANSGSISQAAKVVGLSYKGAWDAVDAMNSMFGEPLVATMTGGKGGGGTQLTHSGANIVDAYKVLQREQKRFLAAASQGINDFENIYQMIRKLSVKTSARNQFFGKVSAIKLGLVNVEVELKLTGGDTIYAVITHDGLNNLDLKVGSDAWAIVKASWIILCLPEVANKLSARNKLVGKVTHINQGNVNTEVVLTLPGGNTVSVVVTDESVTELGVSVPMDVGAVFKASSVILGVSD
jgi:molybdate transport system regulatory protein